MDQHSTLLFGEALPPEKKCAWLVASCICQSKHLCVGSAPQGSGSMDALVTGPAATDASNWGRVVNDDCPCIAVSHTFGIFGGCPVGVIVCGTLE